MECKWDSILPPQIEPSIIDSPNHSQYLERITLAALDPRYTHLILAHCEALLPHICATLRNHGSLAATLATLARIIPFAPSMLTYVELLLSHEEYVCGRSDSSVDDDLLYLLGLFRLFAHDSRSMRKYVNPSVISSLLRHEHRAIVYLAIRILQIYLDGADHWFEEMVRRYLGKDTSEDDINGHWDDGVIDYRFLTLWEEERLDKTVKLLNDTRSRMSELTSHSYRIIPEGCFDQSTALIGATLLPRKHAVQNPHLEADEVVLTPTTRDNLSKFASALQTSQPILLRGLPGSGKTLLVRHVAQRLGMLDDMVTLHLNEQSDAKSLVGIYTTGDTPGSFVWRPGVLTTAVQEGRWILIENLDRAPHEVIGTLLPLIEKRELLIPNRKQTVHAAQSFKIIATVRTAMNHRGEETYPLASMIGERHWHAVPVKMADNTELQNITGQLYPSLASFLSQFLALYRQLQSSGFPSSLVGRTKTGMSRVITPRDLFKWCSRVSKLLQQGSAFTDTVMDEIYLSAIDCFVGALAEGAARAEMTAVIAEELHIDPQRRDYLVRDRDVQYAVEKNHLIVGQYQLSRAPAQHRLVAANSSFSTNPHTSRVLHRVTAAVTNREPLLLIGETGVGKTTAVQHLANVVGKKLVPFNLSQQSEAGDLLGGFKPINIRILIVPMKDRFDELFSASFNPKKNQQFLEFSAKHYRKGNWSIVCKTWRQALKMVDEQYHQSRSRDGDKPSKKRKIDTVPIDYERWNTFRIDLLDLERRLAAGEQAFAFEFVEGGIVKAARNGDWLLLDEINLASPDTLEAIADLFDAKSPSILLAEAGNIERIDAHPDFRVFAAMNPATDVGKKDLPPGIRTCFTELYVDSPDKDIKSLQSIVRSYLRHESNVDPAVALDTSTLYQRLIRLRDENKLVDGAAQMAHFSLRTLTRTLSYAKYVAPFCSIRRALYEGFQMSFLTLLDTESAQLVQPLLEQHLLGRRTNIKAELGKSLQKPSDRHEYLQGFPGSKHWIRCGQGAVQDQPHYILTPFVRTNLENLVRAASTRQFPVLIQGPTSSGKTSMIEYLAKRTGHIFVRINNHEHTDLQEYLGTYVSDSEGQLHFQEGILVQALRHGHWIVLDELNLAPTDVLEALNRLLDDNRELLITETQEVVRPHSDFMLFATQNPAGLYGGRKVLSRAFRNRFLELHFDDIPVDELQEILHRRTQLPESRCRKIVTVYRELSTLRQEGRIFEQKSFATLRDLFRWASRPNDTIQHLAENGFMLLAERVRKLEERQTLKEVIERVLSLQGPRVSIDETRLYSQKCDEILRYERTGNAEIVWTKAMRRLYILVSRAIQNNEPVLLVGNTGCGKTTVCQMLAQAMKTDLHTVNAHQTTETADLIGSQRPVRNRAVIEADLRHQLLSTPSIRSLDTAGSESTDALLSAYDRAIASLESSKRQSYIKSMIHVNVQAARTRFKALFEWVDGPLVHAMKTGSFFLLDEISLADDSVLERINSVLESQRSILLAEKGSLDSHVVANPEFQMFATMNPGGDYGKKELSPALRNRFTEIWVPPLHDADDIEQIVSSKLDSIAVPYAKPMVAFAQWFNERYNTSASSSISVRDVLTWANAVNSSASGDLKMALVHGAAMVYIDTLGANPAGVMALSQKAIDQERGASIQTLSQLLGFDASLSYALPVRIEVEAQELVAGPFSLARKAASLETDAKFSFQPQTTRVNAMRVIRAMQLSKPILLEGSPGVGKTALVTAIAQAIRVPLTRINLSEQTDLLDLFGSDIPVEKGQIGTFTWQDAPFLRAMKAGEWVLLDEMNLASQSVLEGLNSCLDHRGEVFVPELGQTFRRHPEFRLFAAQNPHHQGGGRKGLPASFVNRFTVVFADAFRSDDLVLICQQLFPSLEQGLIHSAVHFLEILENEVSLSKRIGTNGAPWEFNLRDLIRWLSLASADRGLLQSGTSQDFIETLFLQRFRTDADRKGILDLFYRCFKTSGDGSDLFPSLSSQTVQVGLGTLPRDLQVATSKKVVSEGLSSPTDLHTLQSLMICVQQRWPVILTGSSGAGKTSLIENLASTVGASVVTIAINADTDAMDLVGGFEQADMQRNASMTLQQLRHRLGSRLRRALERGPAQELTEALIALDSFDFNNLDSTQLTSLSTALERAGISDASVMLQNVRPSEMAVKKARFEWFDGLLIEALQEGKWLILDNTNLCSSSVLDRLNSLLEPDGMLIMNEHSSSDGSPRVIRPHPSFRIFMTLNPRYGELSRAMRNRAVEIHLSSHPAHVAAVGFGALSSESALSRLRTYKVLATLPRQDHQQQSAYDVLHDHLGVQDAALRSRFERQLEDGLYGVAPTMQDASTTPLRSHLKMELSRFYDSVLGQLQVPTDLAYVQTFHPLNNQALVQFSPQIVDRAHVLALVHETDVRLFAIGNLSTFVERDSETVSKLCRLERSLGMSSTGSQSRSSVSIGLVRKIITSLLESLKTSLSFSTDGLIATRISVGQLCTFCIILLDTVQNRTLDAPSLIALLLAGREIIKSTAIEDVLRSLSPSLQEAPSPLASVTKVISGRACASIWQAVRPSTAKTRAHFEDLLRLEAAVARFDTMSHRLESPLPATIDLRLEVSRALNIATSDAHDLEALCEKFDSLMPISTEPDESVSRYPHFYRTHRSLCEHFAVLMLDDHHALPQSDLTALALLGLYPTKDAVDSHDAALVGSTHMLFKLIASSMSNLLESTASEANDLQSASDIIRSLTSTDQVSLGSLPLLQFELQTLGRTISSKAHLLFRSELDPLNRCLERLLIELLGVLTRSEENSGIHILAVQALSVLQRNTDGAAIVEATRSLSELTIDTGSNIEASLASRVREIVVYLRSTFNSDAKATMQSARAWMTFACVCLRLYVPDIPLDPALEVLTRREIHDKHREDLQSQLEALNLFRATWTGTTNRCRAKVLENDLAELGAGPPLCPVYRPENSQILQMQGDFQALMRMCNNLWHRLEAQKDCPTLDKASVENIIKVRARLAQSYRAYDDFKLPIVGFIDCLLTGHRLATRATAVRQEPTMTSQLSTLLPFAGATMESWLNDEAFLRANSKSLTRSETLFWLSLVRMRSISRPFTNCSPDLQMAVQSRFHQFYTQWRRQLDEEHRQAVSKSSLYRFQGESDDEDPTQEELDEYFAAGETENHQAAKPSREEEADMIVSLHHDLFTGRLHDISGFFGLMRQLPQIAIPPTSWNKSQDILLSILLSLDDRILSTSAEDQTEEYDLYKHANVKEIKSLSELLKRTARRFEEVNQAWPEHATPLNVLRICTQIREISHCAPLPRFLPKVEELHASVHEWQKIASREFSASDVFEELTSLIIGWRQLELSSWTGLFSREKRLCETTAASWWYVAYEAIVAGFAGSELSPTEMQQALEGLLKTLGDFLSSCGLGEFAARLRMLRSFEAQLASMSGEMAQVEQVSQAIHNLVAYYANFENTVNETLTKKQSALEQDMRNIVQIASWKDRNIDVLRQSAQSSHKKLLRLVRKYRRLLAEPVAPIVQGDFPERFAELGDVRMQTSPWKYDEAYTPIADAVTDNKTWNARPARLDDISTTVQKASAQADRFLSTFTTANNLMSWSEELSSSISELQKATPKILTEENRTLVNHLKTRKRRLLADVLKDLRRMGFQSAMGQQVIVDQASTSTILSRLPKLDVGAGLQSIAAARYQFHRLLSVMAKARASAKKPSEDLTRAEVDRCLTLLESLLQTAIVQHGSLSKQVADLNALDVVANQVTAFTGCEDTAVAATDHAVYRNLLAQASGLSLALHLSRHMLLLQEKLSGNSYSGLITFFESKASGLSQLLHSGTKLLKLPPNVGNTTAHATQSFLHEMSHEVNSVVQEAVSSHPEIQPIILQLAKWTRINESTDHLSGRNGYPQVDLDSWTREILSIYDSFLGSLESAQSRPLIGRKDGDSVAWVLNEQQILTTTWKDLDLKSIKDSVQSYASRIQYLQTGDQIGRTHVVSICQHLKPIQDVYLHTAKRLLGISSLGLSQLCRTGHMLATSFISIADQGFCTPSPKSNDDDKKENAAEAGTGLGEGEGGEDISKDIDDDEDLSEAAQGKNPEETTNEMEDEKDAVDMADEELEGEMGDQIQEDAEEDEPDVEDGAPVDEEPTNDNTETPAEKTWDGAPSEEQDKAEDDSSKGGKQQNELSAAREAGSRSPEQHDGDDENAEMDQNTADEEIERKGEEIEETHAEHEQPLDLPEDIDFGDNKPETSDVSDDDMTETGEEERPEPEVSAGDDDSPMQEEDVKDGEHTDSLEASTEIQDPGDEDSVDQPEDKDMLMAEREDALDAEDANGTDSANAAIGTARETASDDQDRENQKEDEDVNADDQGAAEQSQSGAGDQKGARSNAMPPNPQDSSLDEDHSALRQLGDALKEWYRQRQAIQASGDQNDEENPTNESADMTDARFEHVPDDNAPGDTQALGAASAAQSAPLNEDLAMQKEEEDVEKSSEAADITLEDDSPMIDDAAEIDKDDTVADQNADRQKMDFSARSNGQLDAADKDVEMGDDPSSETESNAASDQSQEPPIMPDATVEVMDHQEAYEAWTTYEESTKNLAFVLTERLRLILQPTQATKLRGDYRTGKRLNIKRIIPYIASSYKRDKIWMRRSVPSKRSYQIMLAIDDSKSMSESQNRHLAFETLALITKSMSMLEVGELSVVSFGEDFKLVQDFSQHYSTDAAVETLKQFTFSRNKTNVLRLLGGSLDIFRQARLRATGSARDLWQLQLIISDGICEDHPSIRQLVRQANEERIMIIFIVVDAATTESSSHGRSKQSILDLQTAEFFQDGAGETQLKMVKYLDTFPFNYYLIVRDVNELPGVLAGALQQWFAEVTSTVS